MNQLQTQPNLTPIEIALGIDTDKRTTAKKLYEFLEMDKSQYSRWYKNNITNNEFAEEGIDYEVYDIEVENPQGGRPTQDFKLTASFAKKLSMTAKNEKGEQAREYFIETENKLKEVVIDMEGLSTEMQALLLHDKKIQAVMIHVNKTDNRVDKLENTMTIDYGQQKVLERLVGATVINALGGKDTPAYKQIGKKVFKECNRDIQDRFNVNSRSNIPKLKFEEACEYIRKWEPCTNTKMLIQDYNNQLCLD